MDKFIIDKLNLSLYHPRSWCASLEPGAASMELEMQPEASAPAWSLVRLAGDVTLCLCASLENKTWTLAHGGP